MRICVAERTVIPTKISAQSKIKMVVFVRWWQPKISFSKINKTNGSHYRIKITGMI